MALRELFAIFSVEVDDKKLRTLNSGIDETVDKLKKVAAAFGAGLFVNEIREFIGSQIELGSQINDTAERLGVGTDELQKFQYAAKLSGVEGESAAQSLGFLNKNIGAAVSGNAEAAKSFADLHVQLKNSDGSIRELGDVLPEIADGFSGMGSQQERTTKAMAIFGRSGAALLPILAGGSKGLAELSDEFDRLGGGLSEEVIANADKAGDEIDKLKFSFQGVKNQIALAVLPTLTDFVMKATQVTSEITKLFKQTNVVKAGLVSLGGVGIFATMKLLGGLAKSFGATGEAGGGMIKTLLSLGLKGGLIVAALGAIFLIGEDLYTLFTGGKSAIGEWLDALYGVGSASKWVDELSTSFAVTGIYLDQILGALGPVGDALKDVFGDLTVLDVFNGALWAVKETIDFIVGGVEQLFDWMTDIFEAAESAGNWGWRQLGYSTTKNEQVQSDRMVRRAARKAVAESGVGNEKQTIGGLTAGTNLPATVPLPPNWKGSNGGKAGTVEQSNQISVNVVGGPTNKDTGNAVQQGVRDAMDQHAQTALNALLSSGD